MAQKLKVLVYDIETAPIMGFVWSLWKQNVGLSQIVDTSFMLTWAAKWMGEKRVMSAALTKQEVLDQDDSRIVQELADLIREADIILAHNGDRFDLPIVNARTAYHRQEPLGFVRTIDTLKLAKRDLRLPSNKLDFLGQHFLGEAKIKTDFELWKNVYFGDRKAMKEMLAYNKQDVVLLERVFEAIKPYVTRLPRLMRASKPYEKACPQCGSEHLQRRGYYETQASVFVKLQCQDCKRYSRERTSRNRFDYHPL